MSTFEPVNSPYAGQYAPVPLGAQPVFSTPQMQYPAGQNPFNSQQIPQVVQRQMADPGVYDTPVIKTSQDDGKYHYRPPMAGTKVKIDRDIPDMEREDKVKKSKRKKDTADVVISDTLPPDNNPANDIVEMPTAYTYAETTNMLRNTLGQTDSLNAELMQEFTNVKHNRTMKNKYNVLVGISENVATLLNTKVSIIKEINNSISKSNEMDYKKMKDVRAAQADVNDDKFVADMYRSFVNNPMMNPAQPNYPSIDPAMFGSGVVRATTPMELQGNMPVDVSYMNYRSNLTPEQNSWMYEDNPAVQQVLVFDDATGNKFFQYMNVSTGEIIPNMPTYDLNIVEDTTVDRDHMIAKNQNLNQVFPLVIINENKVNNMY